MTFTVLLIMEVPKWLEIKLFLFEILFICAVFLFEQMYVSVLYMPEVPLMKKPLVG